MGFIFGAFSLIGTAFKAITATAIGSFLVNTAISVGLSLLAQKLNKPKSPQKPKPTGTQIQALTAGEDVSQTFILGQRATQGHLVYRNSHGTAGDRPNAFLVEVIALSDIPRVTLQGVIIGDRLATVGSTQHPERGFPLTNIVGEKGDVRAWIRFYDGTQTQADGYLISKFSNFGNYSWTNAKVGTGIAYAIMTYQYDTTAFQGLPSATFIMGGIPLYDPRKDDTVGGDGSHRWDDQSTWEASGNPAVQVYNILRGIPLPTGEIYGAGVAPEDIPLANAVAGMNICDVTIDGRPQFRTSIEVNVAIDEPADIIEEILGGSLGQIAETGGVWRTRFGPPASPVYAFTDGDISISDPQSFDPIKGLEASFNAIVGTYVDPGDLWQPRTTNLLRNATWEAEDGGRLLSADVQLGTVTSANQANQVITALIKDERRQRQHSLVLPPDAMGLDPLDDVRWTSEINGYLDKDFEVAQTLFDPRSGMMQVTLRERDPDDYDWTASDELPLPPAYEPLPPPDVEILAGWAVTGTVVRDDADAPRRAAVRLSWADGGFYPDDLVQWQIRLASTANIVSQGVGPARDLEITVTEGILPNTNYEARGLLMVAGRAIDWTPWLAATSGAGFISNADFANGVVNLFLDQGLGPIANGPSLPALGSEDGELFFLTTDGQLYEWNDTDARWELKVEPGSLVAADKIVANSITGALMAASAIITQSAQIGDAVVGRAQIEQAAVGSLEIEGNAVSFPYAATSSAGTLLNSTGYTDIVSLVVTPFLDDSGSAQPFLLNMTCYLNAIGADCLWDLRILGTYPNDDVLVDRATNSITNRVVIISGTPFGTNNHQLADSFTFFPEDDREEDIELKVQVRRRLQTEYNTGNNGIDLINLRTSLTALLLKR